MVAQNRQEKRLQRIFDRVVAHARKQRCQAKEGCLCRYRTKAGTKCFAGCLIPDRHYRPWFEGVVPDHFDSFNSRIKKVPMCAVICGEKPAIVAFACGAKTEKEVNLIRCLQRLHDNHEVYNWENGFTQIAMEWGLKYVPPSTNK